MAKRKFSLIEEVQKPSSVQEADVTDAAALATSSEAVKTPEQEIKEIRATFIVDSGIIRKLKLIAALEKRKHKDVIGTALREYVGNWESEHPSVDLKAIDGLVNK